MQSPFNRLLNAIRREGEESGGLRREVESEGVGSGCRRLSPAHYVRLLSHTK